MVTLRLEELEKLSKLLRIEVAKKDLELRQCQEENNEIVTSFDNKLQDLNKKIKGNEEFTKKIKDLENEA